MCRKILSLMLIALMLCSACAEEALPFGKPLSFTTQINANGDARLVASDEPYEDLAFTLQIVDHRGPMHFKKFYAEDFKLSGHEAVLELKITLDDYQGSAPINPNRIILLTLAAENGDIAKGYSLTNWEMAGSSDIPMLSNLPISAFKRYEYDEDAENNMRYLIVHTFNDGVEQTYALDMLDPKGENTFTITYPTLKRKSRGAQVKELQRKLDELGLLQGDVDGIFGAKTEASVKAAQSLLGFEETGVADHDFQRALFRYAPVPESAILPEDSAPDPTPESAIAPDTADELTIVPEAAAPTIVPGIIQVPAIEPEPVTPEPTQSPIIEAVPAVTHVPILTPEPAE